ncbi:MAG TPA: hypothetical protein VKW77_11565, partial [Acidimicrobiales bacterium]|nr:hypothetical protein [Acidimicrobiales bacterium]
LALWLQARADRQRADRERHNAVAALREAEGARGQADAARRRAEAARDRALSSIRNIVFTEGSELDIEEARPYRQALTAAGLHEAQELVRSLEGDPGSEIQLIMAHLALLRVQLDAGRPDAAAETGRKALAMAEALDARRHSSESRATLAATLHRLTLLPGRPEEIRDFARRSNALFEAIEAERPDGPPAEAHSIALNHYNIGNAWFSEGKRPEAAAAFESSVRVCEDAIRRGDRGRGIRLDLARALVYLGRARLQLGRPADAVGPIRQAIATYREWLDESPSDAVVPGLLYLAHEELSFAYQGLGRREDVIACHEAAREMLKATAERHQGVVSRVADLQAKVAVVDYNLAGACEGDLARNYTRYRAAWTEAYAICDKLELFGPLSDDLKTVLAMASYQRADFRAEDGEAPDLEDLARAERLWDELRARQPWSLAHRALLAIVRYELAEDLESLGRDAEAR